MTTRRWFSGTAATATAALLALLVATSASRAAQPDAPHGTDPLSAAEIARSRKIALTTAPATPDESEVVLVERHVGGERSPARRLADVYVYRYSDDTLNLTLVDLTRASVVRVTRSRNVQLPLTANERDRAIDLLFSDDAAATKVGTAYRAATGRRLTSPKRELRFSVQVFLAESEPDRAGGRAARCGEHRCAQLLITTRDRLVIDVGPIVDLSSAAVVASGVFFDQSAP